MKNRIKINKYVLGVQSKKITAFKYINNRHLFFIVIFGIIFFYLKP